jgi:hypothetical protein
MLAVSPTAEQDQFDRGRFRPSETPLIAASLAFGRKAFIKSHRRASRAKDAIWEALDTQLGGSDESDGVCANAVLPIHVVCRVVSTQTECLVSLCGIVPPITFFYII